MTTKNTLRTKLRSALIGLALVGAASLMTGTEALADRDQCLRDGGRPAAEVKVGKCSVDPGTRVGGRGGKFMQSVKVRYWGKGWPYNRWYKGSWKVEKNQPCSDKGTRGEITPTGHHYKGSICVQEIGDQITWHDGASAPWLGSFLSYDPTGYYTRLFRRAGIQHDHCYHHGMATYGNNKKYCDKEMLRKMREECSFRWPSGTGTRNWLRRKTCRTHASKFYKGIRSWKSKPAWENTNTKVRYNDRALLPGAYRLTTGTILSANKKGHWCGYGSVEYEAAGKPKYRQLKSSRVPSSMKYDGACKVKLKRGYYRLTTGAILYANSRGHYCGYGSWRDYVRDGKPKYKQLKASRVPNGMTYDGRCRV